LSFQRVIKVSAAPPVPSPRTGLASRAQQVTQGSFFVVTLGFIPSPPGRLQKMGKLQLCESLTRYRVCVTIM